MFSLQYVLSVYTGSSDVCRETFLTARFPCVRAEEIDDYKRLKRWRKLAGNTRLVHIMCNIIRPISKQKDIYSI